MTWIKLDDNAVDHPKVASLTDRAFRWWVKALSYASRLLTDGLLPPTFWKQVPKQTRAELTGAKLWDWDDPNFKIHDYLSHQSSRDAVAQKRADNAERVTRYRERKRNALQTRDSNAPVTLPETDTENRDREQRQKEQEQGGAPSAPPRPPTLIARNENINWDRKHGRHVLGFCDWVCLAEDQAAEFAGRIPGDDHALKLKQIREWALDIRRRWTAIVPDGSHYEFWRNRWTETHGGSRPANATLKAIRASSDLDEAFK